MIKDFADNCCGCTACCHICPKDAIQMKDDNKGFQKPVVDPQKCIDCGLCTKVCPLKNEHKSCTEQSYYVAKLKQDKKKYKSQSGGAFVALAESILARHGVVYGVVIDKNFDVVYKRATTKQGMYKMRGSKYVQAKIGDSYLSVKYDLENNCWVLFSGTPCHVHGLLMYLQKCKTATEKLITVDLVCHGTPSPLLYKEYLSVYSELTKTSIKKFVFRDTEFSANVFTDLYGNHYWTDEYNKIFYSNLALRDSCFECHYCNFNRVGDLSIGDCWGYEKVNEYFDPNRGCSLIILNTKAGKKEFERIMSVIDYEETIKQHINQHNLHSPTEKPDGTDKFWEDFHRYGGEYVMRKHCDCKLDTGRRVVYQKEHIRRFIVNLKSKIYNAFEH